MRTRQRCEKFRTDVLLLDETMMTYKWMRDVQGPKMEPWGIVFPNHYHAPPSYSHVPDTYSMEQFLAANAKNFKKHPLFKAGAWLGDVQGLADGGVPNWHLVPVGLVAKVMRKGKDMSPDDWLKWYNKKLFPAEPDYYRFDDAAWEWLMRRIVLEWRAKVAFRFSNIAVEKAQASGDISWLKNGTADLEDILRLEMLPEGGKDKSYILADLYNAIGMLTVHMQVRVCVARACRRGVPCFSRVQKAPEAESPACLPWVIQRLRAPSVYVCRGPGPSVTRSPVSIRGVQIGSRLVGTGLRVEA